jgi:Ca-activated chloride channel family protein
MSMKKRFFQFRIALPWLLSALSMIFLLSPLNARADQGVILGKVLDADDQSPLVGAKVLLKLNGQIQTGQFTDQDGLYKFENVEPGTYDLEFSYIGFEKTVKNDIKLEAGKHVKIDILLSQEKAELREVVIISGRQERKVDRSASYSISNISSGKSAMKPRKMAPSGGYNRPDRTSPTEGYDMVNENEFINTSKEATSTFSIDVDAASYSNTRRFLIRENRMPPKESVRLEEFINYFDYDYPQPTDQTPFSITTEISECPWNTQHKLVQVGLQGKKVENHNLPPSNIVFLLDVSGSMMSPDKLELIKKGLKMLVQQLRPEDRVAIVVYAGAAGVVLPSTSGSNRQAIMESIDKLQAGGSTAGGAGINLAYKIAQQNFRQQGNNRVILATDGDFNVGVSGDDALVKLIEEKRKSGIFLTVLGFGTGNLQDSKMEKLADNGNGNYAYIDSEKEAQKVFVNETGGTLLTIAKDVKLQLSFNPEKVKSYRLIGYANRVLENKDFDDDKKDAGELGAGHTVTAMYEVIPTDNAAETSKSGSSQSKSSKKGAASGNELLTVRFRYKPPHADVSKLIEVSLVDKQVALASTSENFRWAASVAGFGMLMRQSKHCGTLSYDEVLDLAKGALGKDANGYRAEFLTLVEAAKKLDTKAAAGK